MYWSNNSEHCPTRGACENNPIYIGYFSLSQIGFEPKNLLSFLLHILYQTEKQEEMKIKQQNL
jgi:hypothetical protein